MATRCPACGEQLAEDARFCGVCGKPLEDSNVGRVVNQRYKLHERIGTGSLGLVYRAEQIGTRRKLAIKLLPQETKNDAQIIRRFKREGNVLCRLRSPHTVTTYEFDRDADGSLYIAMEFPEGRSLAEVFKIEGAFHPSRVLRILTGLCDSLDEAHGLGIVHRDLRPENILLLESPSGHVDFVKVLDFGLAKLLHPLAAISSPGQPVGAVTFASPEALMQRPIDARSDIYQLGILAYLLLSGRHPFHDARGPGDLVAAHVERIPTPLRTMRTDLTIDVEALVARCLEKEPDNRFPDVAAFAAVIVVALRGLPKTSDTIRDEEFGDDDTFPR